MKKTILIAFILLLFLSFQLSCNAEETTDIYEEYLEEPGSYRAEKLLHTNYRKREKYHLED